MAHGLFYYQDAFEKYSNQWQEIQKQKNDLEFKEDANELYAHVAAAIHILEIYRKKWGPTNHKRIADDLSGYFACFATTKTTRLKETMEKDNHAKELFRYAVAKTLNIDLSWASDEQKQNVATEMQTRIAQPTQQVRNLFLATMISSMLNNIKLKEEKSDFATICKIFQRKFNLHLEEGAIAKLDMAVNYSKHWYESWDTVDKRRQQEINRDTGVPEPSVNTKSKCC